LHASEIGLAAAPAVGQDSRAVLRAAGFDDAGIDALVAAGTVREAGSAWSS
jgi:crotonobetainyl-CoA:carnitine CoA-transferase CaiB-like acyl-CoA transferase